MAVKKRKVRGGGGGSTAPTQQTITLAEGDWLDVLDCDGIWNVARVLSIPSLGKAEIAYDGWPKRYNEVVSVDCDRVAPYQTFTWNVKCWVKYLNWPMWPSVVMIRTPGTEEGIANLKKEQKLFVDFFDHPDFAKRARYWQKKSQVQTFEENYEANRQKTDRDQFEQALGFMLQSDANTEMPHFSRGTLPIQYTDNITKSVEETRKAMGNELWCKRFADNRDRHQQAHLYLSIGDVEVNIEEATTSDDLSSDVSPTRTKLKLGTKEGVVLSAKTTKKRPYHDVSKETPSSKENKTAVVVEAEIDDNGDSFSEDEEMTTPAKKMRRPKMQSRAKEDAPTRTRSTGSKGCRKGQIKMAARRSIASFNEYLNLNAHATPSASSLLDDEVRESDNDDKALKDVVPTKSDKLKSVIKHHSSRAKKKPEKATTKDAGVSSQADLQMMNQRIADAREYLRELKLEKQRALEAKPSKERVAQKNETISSKIAYNVKARHPRGGRTMQNFVERAAVEQPTTCSKRKARVDQDLHPKQLNHSFFSEGKAYASDSEESKTCSDDEDSKDEEKENVKAIVAHNAPSKQDTADGGADEDSQQPSCCIM